ncbi:MAG: sulfite exporter TauE/SafE family protein [Anaerolineae bacterium]
MDNLGAILLAGALAGLAKGGLGPLGAVITPIMILAMPPEAEKQAVGFVLLMLIVGDWFALYVYWGRWDRQRTRPLLLGAVVGIAIGAMLLAGLSSEAVRRLVGVVGLFLAGYTLVQDRLAGLGYQPRTWHGVLSGGAAGFTSSLANAGGPPFNAYMLLQNLDPRTFVATATLFFAVVNVIKLPFFLWNGALRFDLVPSALPGMALVPVGVWVGKQVVEHINRRVFNGIVWIGLVISSIVLLYQ